MNVLEAERHEKESLANLLREREQLQVQNVEPEVEQQETLEPVTADVSVEDEEDEFMDMDDFLDAADLNAGELVGAEVQVDAAVLVDAAIQVDPPVQQQP
ncbi:hypothetical protein AVEN_164229-1 [Araneus ventricosus]|uniref:Uncharacterized protein n=1 Tax=Araneus ventricosus TaxID=182803 RepID=A0A4Y2IF29_ARAVE|nr:hypothetical protein AVEN_164229-1 [Araneus ventricosus]